MSINSNVFCFCLDEEWIQNPTDSTLYLMNHNHHHHQVTLPRPSRHNSESDNNKHSPDLIKPEKNFANFTRYQQQTSPQKLINKNKSNDEISTRFSSTSNVNNDFENKTKPSKYSGVDNRYVEERSVSSRRYHHPEDDSRYESYNREEYERRDRIENKNHYEDYKETAIFRNKYDEDDEARSKGGRYADVG